MHSGTPSRIWHGASGRADPPPPVDRTASHLSETRQLPGGDQSMGMAATSLFVWPCATVSVRVHMAEAISADFMASETSHKADGSTNNDKPDVTVTKTRANVQAVLIDVGQAAQSSESGTTATRGGRDDVADDLARLRRPTPITSRHRRGIPPPWMVERQYCSPRLSTPQVSRVQSLITLELAVLPRCLPSQLSGSWSFWKPII